MANPISKAAVLNLGFRPFFTGAALFVVISMALWMGVYILQWSLPVIGISLFQWHAHEMIYGFTMAVIAGFLLTAVKNWTGVQTLYGFGLLGLLILWVLPRILFLFGTRFIFIAAFFDVVFMLCLTGSVIYPIVKVKQWKQMGIMAKLVLLAACNSCFYLGAAGVLEQGVYWGIYGGLFLIVGLIITMGRRLIPFFVEVSVGYPVKLFNSKWLDTASLILYLVFFTAEVFIEGGRTVASFSAGLLFIVTTARLIGWHTAGIWKKPLLWSLFISFSFIDGGFLLAALRYSFDVPNVLIVHAFSFGGIGLVTLSMMARVSLGHTGRDVQNPPQAITFSFILLIIGGIVRVVPPLMNIGHYWIWILFSQILWIAAFAIFIAIYAPMLVKPRVDGRPG